MDLIVSADHLGTSEENWLASDRLRGLPALDVPAGGRALVVAPHPDDEVLGAGGLVQRLLAASTEFEVLAITDGENSHPRSYAVQHMDLPTLRSGEVFTSLRHLGWDLPKVTRLGIPDGHVRDHEDDVARAVRARLGPGDLCIAPWGRDGHPDHDAAGRASATVSAEVCATSLGYLVWAWHWASPTGTDLPWAQMVRLDFEPGETARKRRAVRAFRSQVRPLGADPEDAPVLPPPVLRRFLRSYEVYIHGPQWS